MKFYFQHFIQVSFHFWDKKNWGARSPRLFPLLPHCNKMHSSESFSESFLVTVKLSHAMLTSSYFPNDCMRRVKPAFMG